MPSSVLYVLSGAGLSAESGVATFRTAGGLWTKVNLDRVCNALTWKQHRSEVFEFYRGRRAEVAEVQPCDAHRMLANWQQVYGADRVKLLTQNVDDLLERAGALEVTHLHGDLQRLHCTACETYFAVDDQAYAESTRCPKCTSIKGVKPAVVFFGQSAPEYKQLFDLKKSLRDEDVLLVVGTAMNVVDPDRFFARHRAGHALNLQVNPDPAFPEFFGTNVAEGASAGLARLESLVTGHLENN